MSEYTPKLVHMPGTRLSPDVVLHRTLNKIDHIKAVVVVIQWKDETFETDHSSLSLAHLCMANMTLDHLVRNTVFDKPSDD